MGAKLLASVTTTTSGTSTDSFVDVPLLTATVNVASTASLILLIATVQINAGGIDDCVEFQFAHDGTREGPRVPTFQDAADEGQGLFGFIHVLSGLSGSHTFSLKYASVASKHGDLDTDRTRSFQVVELTGSTLLAEVDTAASGSDSTNTMAEVGAMTTGSVTVDSTSNVVLMIANCPLSLAPTGDDCARFRWADGGTREGSAVTVQKDAPDEGNGLSGFCWAKTGISGSHTFALHWQTSNGTRHAEIDTTRPRTLYVIEVVDCDLDEVESATADSSPATWADVANLSLTTTIENTDSIVLLIGNVALLDNDSSDDVADFQIAEGGTREGPLAHAYKDADFLTSGPAYVWAKKDISGSKTFSLQWQTVASRTLGANTTDTRSLQVLDIKTLAAVDAPILVAPPYRPAERQAA